MTNGLNSIGSELWTDVLDRLRQKVNPQSFRTWFRPTRLLAKEAGTLKIEVPNRMFAEWIKSNYLGLIAETVREIDGRGWEIVFTSPPDRPVTAAPVPALQTQLDSRYTFDSFVVGTSNQFAHAGAVAVAQQPGRAHNPLFIYGGTGLGKTHLLQAVGNSIAQSGTFLRIRYLTTESFMNEMINMIRFEKGPDFKEKYRNVDVLLIDDIQFLAGKERTQEELFHTFDALYYAHHQIVLTSDCAPADIPTLQERLKSRFEWGLTVDIQPPELETRIAILNKKGAAEGIALPSDVALLIASKVKSSVRELEGALARVSRWASMNHVPIGLELAKDALRGVVTAEPPVITVESIQKVVADFYDLKVAELKSKNNSAHVSFPRQIAMYLSKSLTDKSLQEIGKRFGGKHHSTVIHAIRKIEEKRGRERDFDRIVHRLSEMFL
jgi:chromosomal replication initiator protein